ncbi:hypothetical protein BDV24DRAFT_131487 [Aspergillus arachidicola]|uniref:Uncharacterized protein n=1 Tax=Aspergillus arachidicola TaxID=656916 RepID=A0A5N6Y8L4_9EURO|nr:hypothetical protein BDV24DRAFT_131487 [Aspergillus arachidicola]
MIIQIALDLDEQHKPTSVPKVWEAYPGRRRKRPPGQSVSRTALPLILSCKTLCTITHAIILSHVQFWSPHHWRRDALLKSLDQASLLPKLRHVAIKLGNDDDNTWDGKGQSYEDDGRSDQPVSNTQALWSVFPMASSLYLLQRDSRRTTHPIFTWGGYNQLSNKDWRSSVISAILSWILPAVGFRLTFGARNALSR